VTAPDFRKLLVIGFDDQLKANEFLLAALRMRKNDKIQLHDAVFVQRDAEGRSAVQETQDISTGRGALGGALWGVLIGTLLGGPLGGVIGGAATAGSGALLAKLIDTGIKDKQIADLRELVSPGSTALALLVSHLSVADLQRELTRFPGATLVESDLSEAAVAAVRNALAEAGEHPYGGGAYETAAAPPAPAAAPAVGPPAPGASTPDQDRPAG
jgi:uncharacterized membrane protein